MVETNKREPSIVKEKKIKIKSLLGVTFRDISVQTNKRDPSIVEEKKRPI